ncbi:unnamed protein product [Polarella glacialis]|uniref:Uncharacterized protein n=1 Tax=Polarella glacialis TaxID=89957 RepID=A0A813IE07_POLGL|nr:unnamed protein product [Polarella glacialis]CAE8649021.1 unnamed protein product [Polarella glacialis]
MEPPTSPPYGWPSAGRPQWTVGEAVYSKVKREGGLDLAARGTVVEVGQLCILAASPTVLSGSSVTIQADDTMMAFVRVDAMCLRRERPTGWDSIVGMTPWPSAQVAIDAYNRLDEANPTTESSDELRPPGPPPVSKAAIPSVSATPPGLAQLLAGLGGIWPGGPAPGGQDPGFSDDEDEDSSDEEARRKAPVKSRKASGRATTSTPAAAKASAAPSLEAFLNSGLQGGNLSLQDVLMAKVIQDMAGTKSKPDKKAFEDGNDSDSGTDDDLDGSLLKRDSPQSATSAD